MELGFYDLFTSYDMEVETHVHVQIENQLRCTCLGWCTCYGYDVMMLVYGI